MKVRETEFTVPDTEPTVTIRRDFRASRRRVFEAMTRPELVGRWYGPARYRIEVPELDPRPGGKWRFLNIDKADGTIYGFHGVFREIVPDERIVQTWIFEGAPDVEVLSTADLQEHGGYTTLIATSVYPSMESRDADMQQGMIDGAAETYDRLAELVETEG